MTTPFEILEEAIRHLDFAPTTQEDQLRVEGALAAVKDHVAELEAKLDEVSADRDHWMRVAYSHDFPKSENRELL